MLEHAEIVRPVGTIVGYACSVKSLIGPSYALLGNAAEFLDPVFSSGVHLALESRWNGRRVGLTEAGPEMSFHFGQLIAHVAKTRRLRAGSIVGSGTVSNQD